MRRQLTALAAAAAVTTAVVAAPAAQTQPAPPAPLVVGPCVIHLDRMQADCNGMIIGVAEAAAAVIGLGVTGALAAMALSGGGAGGSLGGGTPTTTRTTTPTTTRSTTSSSATTTSNTTSTTVPTSTSTTTTVPTSTTTMIGRCSSSPSATAVRHSNPADRLSTSVSYYIDRPITGVWSVVRYEFPGFACPYISRNNGPYELWMTPSASQRPLEQFAEIAPNWQYQNTQDGTGRHFDSGDTLSLRVDVTAEDGSVYYTELSTTVRY